MNYRTIIGNKEIEREQVDLGKKAWPIFMQHDSIVEKHWPNLYTDFLRFQFAAFSENGIVGIGNSVPINWDVDLHGLPVRGLDWAMEKADHDLKRGLIPNLLIGVQILINPDLRNRGISYEFLDMMKQIGRTQGIRQVALPVRPTSKHLYPLVPMEEYIEWTNEKGEAFDSWIRVHVKAGGKIVSICPESMTIQGSVKDWEAWTGLSFQGSGQYPVEKALCPVNIDIENDLGVYIEPNVWIIHDETAPDNVP